MGLHGLLHGYLYLFTFSGTTLSYLYMTRGNYTGRDEEEENEKKCRRGGRNRKTISKMRL
jgi:hypothetical protein